MEPRPKIKLSLSRFDRTVEITALVLLLIAWGISVFAYFNSPAIIPVHFDITGTPDRYGAKWMVLVLPVIPTVLYLGLTLLGRYPHTYNYTVKITAENAETQYAIATGMIRMIKLSVLVIFLLIAMEYITVKGKSTGPGVWFLPLCIVLLITPVTYAIIRSRKEAGRND